MKLFQEEDYNADDMRLEKIHYIFNLMRFKHDTKSDDRLLKC